MSINAISSVSLYEYYYKINNEDEKKKKSPLADELEKYGIVPTDDESLNILMLKRAKELEKEETTTQELSHADRPWADLMYQLNIQFNEDPADDIQDIKDELTILLKGIEDEELETEIKDLQDYVERLYISFTRNSANLIDKTYALEMQMSNLSMVNKINFL
jgi:hypothetical protein